MQYGYIRNQITPADKASYVIRLDAASSAFTQSLAIIGFIQKNPLAYPCFLPIDIALLK